MMRPFLLLLPLFALEWYYPQVRGYVIPLQKRRSFDVRSTIFPHDKLSNKWHRRRWLRIHQQHDNMQCFSASTTNREDEYPKNDQVDTIVQSLTLLTPLWTVLAAAFGNHFASIVSSSIGSVKVVSRSLFILMLVMALSTTPQEFSKALQSPKVMTMNAVCCFGLMPMLAILVARIIQCDPSQTTGTLLLGCVCGGQASNLFAFLAGGDVSLSVICTLSTTLLGVVATPILTKLLLTGSSSSAVVVDGVAVLKSVVTLVLGPLVMGIGCSRLIPRLVRKYSKIYPLVGISATLCLVAGGAANSAKVSFGLKATLASILLPLLGGFSALLIAHGLPERSKRTLVIEVLSKSPTLAYVLALKHFDAAAAAVPAAGMVSLAVVGALVASTWSLVDIPGPHER